MPTTLEQRRERLLESLRPRGQEHVFRWWNDLDTAGRAGLLDQVEALDLELLDRLRDLLDAPRRAMPPGCRPPSYVPLPPDPARHRLIASARAAGEQALRRGEVAVVTVAGGQGTRLGFDRPKGLFPIGPVTGKSLFQLHAEQIRALRRRYGRPVPWAVMVSEATDAPTREYFERQGRFGLPEEDVLLFRQGMLPALDLGGRLILAEKGRLFTSPNGHGGTLQALQVEGVLDRLTRRGIRHLFYFQVDNPAVRVADPVFLGHHILNRAEMSLKVLERRDADEKIGVVVADGEGRLHVVEYSDLPPEEKYARDESGRLKFPLGSPAIHILDVDFVRRLAVEGPPLPYHVARKAIPHIDEKGRAVAPREPNGVKFEMFIFDALPHARRSVLVEMDRQEEFAPVKNASGEDSPESCRRLLSRKFARWLRCAGPSMPADAEGNPPGMLEISPLVALEAEDLPRDRLRDLPPVRGDLYLGPESFATRRNTPSG